MTSDPQAPLAERANDCHESYMLHVYCCAPHSLHEGAVCNALGKFTGDAFSEARKAAEAAGWKIRVAGFAAISGWKLCMTGFAAWCPIHAGRSYEERASDFADRAACTAPRCAMPGIGLGAKSASNTEI